MRRRGSLGLGWLGMALCVMLVTNWARPCSAADWQWSVPIESGPLQAGARQPRALLWIPPQCRRVRAVVVAQQTLQEASLLEHPLLREACGKLDFAEICISPALDPVFHFERGAGSYFNAMLAVLASESGYQELRDAPVVPLGSGASAHFPWNFAAWNPDRTLCALSVGGQWPYSREPNAPPWGRRTLSMVPGLVTLGQYEDGWERAGAGLVQRGQNPFVPLSFLAEPGAGARDISDAKMAYLALYLAKAARYRLPAAPRTPVEPDNGARDRLLPIDPTVRGFLVDRPRLDGAPRSAPAPAGLYAGNPAEAFWSFDEELATATENLLNASSGKQVALLGIVQEQRLVAPEEDGSVRLNFLPEGDGTLFKVAGEFLNHVPAGTAQSWTRFPSGTPLPVGAAIGHPDGGGPVVMQPLGGPVQQLNDDTFAVRFDGVNCAPVGAETPDPIWLQVSQPGDEEYRRSVLTARLDLPAMARPGTGGAIHFPAVPDQLIGVTGCKLRATGSDGRHVHYSVESGPGEMEDDVLTFTAVPPRAKLPLKMTVVAWQWGAPPVGRTFYLTDVLPVPADRISPPSSRAALWEAARREATALAATAALTPVQPLPETPVVPQNHAG